MNHANGAWIIALVSSHIPFRHWPNADGDTLLEQLCDYDLLSTENDRLAFPIAFQPDPRHDTYKAIRACKAFWTEVIWSALSRNSETAAGPLPSLATQQNWKRMLIFSRTSIFQRFVVFCLRSVTKKYPQHHGVTANDRANVSWWCKFDCQDIRHQPENEADELMVNMGNQADAALLFESAFDQINICYSATGRGFSGR